MDNLKTLRMRQNLTQQQVADMVGVGRQAYAKWETGDREPDRITLIKLADFFQVTTDYLLGRPKAQISFCPQDATDSIERVRTEMEQALRRPISRAQAEAILVAFDRISNSQ